MKKIPSSDPLSNPYFSSEDREWVAVVNKRYELEDLWLNAVRAGDPEKAREYLLPYLIVRGDFSYLQIEPMENARRACRTINVSCRIVSREGGLPPLYLHNLCEKFGTIITCTEDMQELKKDLPLRIVEEYARAVKCFSTHGYGRLVNGAVQYLCTHIIEEISISHIAEELFVSEAHLSRMFRKETGKSITQYLNEMRIEMAKNLLKQGGRNITQVATMVGYRDSCYFSRVFHAVTGTSPKKYAQSSWRAHE